MWVSDWVLGSCVCAAPPPTPRYAYAAGLTACTVIQTMTVHQFWYQGIRVGVHMKTVLGGEVRVLVVVCNVLPRLSRIACVIRSLD